MPRYRVLEDRPGQRLVLGSRQPAITFDRDGISFVRGWLGTLRLARAAIESVQLVAPPRGAGHELSLAVRHATRWSIREEVVTFSVLDLDLDTEALDLAFRIAHALGLEGFVVRDRTIDLLARGPVAESPYRVAVGPMVRNIDELAGGTLAVPAVVAPAAYAGERARFVEPAAPVGEVREGEVIAGITVDVWQPGRAELATQRSVSKSRVVWNAFADIRWVMFAIVLFVVVGAAFEGCRRWTVEGLDQPGSGFVGWKDYVVFPFVVLVLIVLALATILLFVGIPVIGSDLWRRVRADLRYLAGRRVSWDAERLAIDGRGVRVSIATPKLRGVLLRSHAHFLDEARRWSELLVTTADDEILVLVAPPGPPHTHRELERLAIGLARLFDLPWQIPPATSSEK